MLELAKRFRQLRMFCLDGIRQLQEIRAVCLVEGLLETDGEIGRKAVWIGAEPLAEMFSGEPSRPPRWLLIPDVETQDSANSCHKENCGNGSPCENVQIKEILTRAWEDGRRRQSGS